MTAVCTISTSLSQGSFGYTSSTDTAATSFQLLDKLRCCCRCCCVVVAAPLPTGGRHRSIRTWSNCCSYLHVWWLCKILCTTYNTLTGNNRNASNLCFDDDKLATTPTHHHLLIFHCKYVSLDHRLLYVEDQQFNDLHRSTKRHLRQSRQTFTDSVVLPLRPF
jgi:hypothetical protein